MKTLDLVMRSFLVWSFMVLAIGAARAAVTTTGSVSPSQPLTWTVSTDVTIGGTAGGSVMVNEGSVIQSRSARIGGGSASRYGDATLNGAGSTWYNASDLNIGGRGTGVLRIEDNAAVNVGGNTLVNWDAFPDPQYALGEINFRNGTLTTAGLMAGSDQLTGVGTIHTQALFSDVDLVFDATHGLQQDLHLSSRPGQDITIRLDLTDEEIRYLGFGYRSTGSLLITDGVKVKTVSGYLGYLAGAEGTATIEGEGSSWESSGHLSIGDRGAGKVYIRSGATVENTNGTLGNGSGSSGTVTITGIGSTWNNRGSLIVGNSGEGSLLVEGGATVVSQNGRVGYNHDGRGSVVVAGAGSKWIGSIIVGRYGEGSLTVEEGGEVSNGGTIGNLSGSIGSAIVAGIGSKWKGSVTVGDAGKGTLVVRDGASVDGENIYVGKVGEGEVYVNSGSTITAIDGYVGYEAGSAGEVTLSGEGSSWRNRGAESYNELYLGYSGEGALNVTDGAVVEKYYCYLGFNAGSMGKANIGGSGTALNTSSLYVGHTGSGALGIEQGGVVSSGGGYVGTQLESSGVVTVSGVGSTWLNRGDLRVGLLGDGAVSISDGGLVTVGGDTYVGWQNMGEGELSFDSGELHTVGLLAGGSQLKGVGKIFTRSFVSDVDVVFDDEHGMQQDFRVTSEPGQDITIHLDLINDGSRDFGVGYQATGSLVIADGRQINSRYGYVGYLSGSIGTAEVIGPDSSWSLTDRLAVGDHGIGSLAIRNGATVRGTYAAIGAQDGSSGSVTVSGMVSSWVNSSSVTVGFRGGKGTLAIESGGSVVSSAGTVAGHSSSASAAVVGVGSSWVMSGDLYIGTNNGQFDKYGGDGTLNITQGATVSNSRGYVGQGARSKSVVEVVGEGSTWVNQRDLAIGSNGGEGALLISDGGVVRSGNGHISSGSSSSSGYSSSGSVLVTGESSAWIINGDLNVGTMGVGVLEIADDGLVDVGSVGSKKSVRIYGQTSRTGSVSLAGGFLRLYGGSIQQQGIAAFNFNDGRLEGVEFYQVGAGLTQNGGVLAPGNSAGVTTIVGSYVLNSGALEIELLNGSGVAGTAFDRLVVNNGVTLGVSSQLNLLLSYAASVGDSFLIVDSKNSAPINGAFANGDELTAEYESLRYSFSLNYAAGTGNDIALTVASVSLIGDYNADGFVDAADYTVWRDAAGTNVAAYAGADGNGDGVVDDGDHAVWAAHYGVSLEAAMAQAVPEPAGVVLAVLALIAGGRRRVGSGCSAS